jgi:molybdenum cofactor guanylyltransferase
MSTKVFLLEDIDHKSTYKAIEKFCSKVEDCLLIENPFDLQRTIDNKESGWLIISCYNWSIENLSMLKVVINYFNQTESSQKYLIICSKYFLDLLGDLSHYYMMNLQMLNLWNSTVGLVLCGGQSLRMSGKHKAFLKYNHDIEQYKYMVTLLKPYLGEVFISIKEELRDEYDKGYNYLYDNYQDIGPMSGLASAFVANPETNYLVVGCDYPLLKELDILLLLKSHSDKYKVTCYKNEVSIDPMIAIYTKDCAKAIATAIEQKKYSLKHLIIEDTYQGIDPIKSSNIISVDDTTSYLNIINKTNEIKNKR